MYRPEDRRWNFCAALIDAAGWGLGIGIVSYDTFLPLFVSDLHGSHYAVGLIRSLLSFGWYVPGILLAVRIERLARVKRFVVGLAFVERSYLLAMVPLCLWLGPAHRGALLGAFFVSWGGMTFTMGCNNPGYLKLIAKTVPPELRGRLYGVGGAVAGLLGILGANLARWLLHGLGYPAGYAACFGVACLIQTLTMLPLAFLREPAHAPTHSLPEERPNYPMASSMPGKPGAPSRELRASGGLGPILRNDPVLQRFIVVGVLFAANGMAAAFYAEYAIDRFHAGVSQIALFTSILMAAQVIANLVCGWVGDHQGNKRLLELGLAAGVAAPLLAWFAPSAGWLYPVFALNQIAVTSWGIAQINYVLDLCGPERTATYSALAGLLIGPFRAAAPLAGAWLVGLEGYRSMFGLCGGLTALALAVSLRWVAEPRNQAFRPGTREAGGGVQVLGPILPEHPHA